MKLIILRRRLGWYWRLVAKNGRILAVGAEPFSSKHKARNAVTLTLFTALWNFERGMDSLPIEYVEPKRKAVPHAR